ncbi:predicted protein [Sclerotinia sclerotiorum 1980 UF-70]|uniref:Uncharacterized protein n=1 Tax=Sclerotinia sclerotiorum (strain ATCC 18683 / 1980 / Ss-1) TaxID=665079 RepID=A7EW51_SCLS1|nr:predicted protein [Sclerotinia sclerotiorum 1980 UF-70]EDN93693.1 predicted protein [Sclerotinia sclerotiorum 1980 UF-70]
MALVKLRVACLPDDLNAEKSKAPPKFTAPLGGGILKNHSMKWGNGAVRLGGCKNHESVERSFLGELFPKALMPFFP